MNYLELTEKLKQLNDKDSYLRKIKRNDYSLMEIPEYMYVDKDLISFLKSKSYININEIGYDVLRLYFYVDFSIDKPQNKKSVFPSDDHQNLVITFDNFDDYYNYLDGNIYDNSCYFGFVFNDELVETYNIDLSKIKYESSITESVLDFKLAASKDDKKDYRDAERKKASIKKWIERINNAQTQNEFNKVIRAIRRSSINIEILLNIIINQLDDKYIYLLFNYINEEYYLSFDRYAYFIVFYKKGISFFDNELSSKLSKKYKKNYKEMIIPYQEENGIIISKGFSPDIHFFYVKSKIGQFCYSVLYFETFDEFVKYLDNDLTNCDLSKLNDSNINFNLYKINAKTKLPINDFIDYKRKIKKIYDLESNRFIVEQSFVDNNDNVIKYDFKDFKKFADFIKYVNYDLSGADLIFCDELANVPNLYEYNIDKAKVRSNVLIQNNIEFTGISLNLLDFDKSNQMNNEDFSIERYNYDRELAVNEEENNNDRKIYYISDLHLEFRLAKEESKTEEDVIYVLTKLAKEITKYYGSIVIIPGDISGDINLFKKFLEILSKYVKKGIYEQYIIFTLGNHELWPFANKTMDYIINGYRKMISSYGFYLLHNEIMYFKDEKWNYYNQDIINSNEFELLVRTSINSSKIILFGGIGFAGKNDSFNANNGIYMNTINREQEKRQSLEFESLYTKIAEYLSEYRVIVATHMPLLDWSNQGYHNNFIYVSGHTHKNHFYDDGEIRVYSDNQVGYKSRSYKLKYFYLDDSFDCFKYFDDGIHPITPEQYKEFYYGKRIGMSFNRDFTDMYLIKKNGYYMFVHEYERSLCILNGGAEKKLPIRNKNYYFDNFEEEIRLMKGPLDEYTKIQNEVSNSIKKIGGIGTIHGAIVDISFLCHVYVNPYDLKLTYYYALDIIDKTVYKSLPDLLKKHEKELYINYSKMISNGSKFEIESFKSVDFTGKSIKYYDTDIYKASRKLKQMQKLQNNIIAIWIELPNQTEFNDKELNILTTKIEASIGLVNYKKIDNISSILTGDIIYHSNFGEGMVIDITNKKHTLIQFKNMRKDIDIEFAFNKGYIVGKK